MPSGVFHICALAVKLSPTATARTLCLYACLWRALKRAPLDEFKRHIPKRRSEYKLDGAEPVHQPACLDICVRRYMGALPAPSSKD